MTGQQDMQNPQPPVEQPSYQSPPVSAEQPAYAPEEGQPAYQPPAAPAGSPPMYQPQGVPAGQLKTNRGLGRFILFSIITLGIYSIVFFSSISSDINLIASRYDGRKTMHYCLLLFLVGPLTLGIAYFVWFHRISGRIGLELERRQIPYSFGAKDYWLWSFLGSLIIVGPFIYLHKLSKAANHLAAHYNTYG